jgi:hypothetical protein
MAVDLAGAVSGYSFSSIISTIGFVLMYVMIFAMILGAIFFYVWWKKNYRYSILFLDLEKSRIKQDKARLVSRKNGLKYLKLWKNKRARLPIPKEDYFLEMGGNKALFVLKIDEINWGIFKIDPRDPDYDAKMKDGLDQVNSTVKFMPRETLRNVWQSFDLANPKNVFQPMKINMSNWYISTLKELKETLIKQGMLEKFGPYIAIGLILVIFILGIFLVSGMLQDTTSQIMQGLSGIATTLAQSAANPGAF